MEERTATILTPGERVKRFWTAHGRTCEELTVLHALANNPTVTWTPEGLCIWYGVRVDRARRILAALASCGIAQPAGGGGYRWNAAQDFAVPHTSAARSVLSDRWTEVALEDRSALTSRRGRSG